MFEFQINVAESDRNGHARHLFRTDWIDDVLRFKSMFVEIDTRFPASDGFTVTASKRSKSMHPLTRDEITWTDLTTE
ncbi:hypothetical protein [Burkholderia ubonensis]|uniref:hypothetical protein n=1 Tax=Burkholderia ubonensis TaxID=101571 RepID=UPI00075F3BC5|nr:hypothetical protein [Burkholderia ubonensis]KVZ02985.1 hypothetical protein WL11_16785 [Burkholderia ubonensis]